MSVSHSVSTHLSRSGVACARSNASPLPLAVRRAGESRFANEISVFRSGKRIHQLLIRRPIINHRQARPLQLTQHHQNDIDIAASPPVSSSIPAMSFKFQWPEFSPDFHADAKSMLNSALNRGPKPKVIADDIRVEELSMGSVVSVRPRLRTAAQTDTLTYFVPFAAARSGNSRDRRLVQRPLQRHLSPDILWRCSHRTRHKGASQSPLKTILVPGCQWNQQ